MKTTARIILLAMTLFLLAACQQTAEPEATVDLAGTNWILSSLNGELPLAGTAVTLQFGTDGSVFGTDGCNRYNTPDEEPTEKCQSGIAICSHL